MKKISVREALDGHRGFKTAAEIVGLMTGRPKTRPDRKRIMCSCCMAPTHTPCMPGCIWLNGKQSAREDPNSPWYGAGREATEEDMALVDFNKRRAVAKETVKTFCKKAYYGIDCNCGNCPKK